MFNLLKPLNNIRETLHFKGTDLTFRCLFLQNLVNINSLFEHFKFFFDYIYETEYNMKRHIIKNKYIFKERLENYAHNIFLFSKVVL